MTSLLQTLKSRFDNRPDSEHGQALTRVAMLVVVLAYLQFVVKGHAGVERGLALSLSFLALEFVVAIGILGWIAARPGVSYPRRVVGMAADYSLMGVHVPDRRPAVAAVRDRALGHGRQRPALWPAVPLHRDLLRGHHASGRHPQHAVLAGQRVARLGAAGGAGRGAALPEFAAQGAGPRDRSGQGGQRGQEPVPRRSEEHTSELKSIRLNSSH